MRKVLFGSIVLVAAAFAGAVQALQFDPECLIGNPLVKSCSKPPLQLIDPAAPETKLSLIVAQAFPGSHFAGAEEAGEDGLAACNPTYRSCPFP